MGENNSPILGEIIFQDVKDCSVGKFGHSKSLIPISITIRY